MQEVQEVVRKKMRTRRAIILLGVSMALLFLASALLPTEPSAQTTSPEGKIVYVKLGDIWVMDADGTNQTNLTNTPDTNEDQPAWSSDGTRIAFTSDQDEVPPFTDIWVMNSDGSNQTNLTPTDNPGTPTEETDNFHEYQPSWAPSGAQLAFVREIPGEIISEQSDIFVMDANGQTPATPLTQTDANEREPDWSPDGTKIAFAGVRNQGWEIVTMDPNGQNEAILTGDSFDGEDRGPDWSPDSTMVVFQKQCQGGCSDAWEIWGVNRDGSGDTNLTPNDLSEEDLRVTQHTGPSWSPDGSEITFTRTRPSVEGGQSDIYAMPAPATLPPPPTGEPASTTTMEQGEDGIAFAETTLVRPLTTDGLSSEPDWADTPADTTPPKVMSTSPANGAKRIAPGVNVTATFTEAMDPSTINATTFKLVRLNADGTTTRVTAAVSYDAATKKATLNPSSNLSSRRTYKATVTSGAQDVWGNALDQNPNIAGNQSKNWKFTVR
jgi:dipeptidyl aminopeptidase/acylaminoacyl peptidase